MQARGKMESCNLGLFIMFAENCTSGLDGSIAYEADRAENPGLFVSDTLNFVSLICPQTSVWLC
jgi:hypothetical protein